MLESRVKIDDKNNSWRCYYLKSFSVLQRQYLYLKPLLKLMVDSESKIFYPVYLNSVDTEEIKIDI